MTDIYQQADEALATLEQLEEQAREDARRNAQPAAPVSPEHQARRLADELQAHSPHWIAVKC